ncbi:restriction endonuclease subunit S [Escherichia coli]|nr:restriction endonuclease subunit S [Escherichia coli]EKX1214647.1 restriction endonuclease subunit S [Escherichia coli]
MMKISEMPKYDDYVDSGVEWLGRVPASWELTRLGTRFNERRSKVSDIDYPALSVTKKGVLPQLDNAAKTKDGDNRKLVKEGDFVINSRSDRKGSSGVSDRDGSVSLINIVLKPKGIHPKFSEHLLKSHAFIEEYYRVGRGIVADLWTTRYDEMRTITISVPSLEEQTRIANFLDKKTALIDEAISIKEQQISLLKERKQIIIQQAVTQGLDPNVPMKDSCVDWIGKVPAHWEVKKMKFIFDSIQTGTTPVTSEPKYFDGDVDWYNPKDLNAGYLDKSEKTISELAIKHGQAKIFPGDSVLIVGIGATCGKTAYLKSSSAFNQQITGFSSRHENAEFMYYLISMYSSVMLKVANYTTLPILNNEFFKHFLLPCPSKIEQDRIVGFLRIETLKFEKTIEIQLQQIERLKEYKTTLINSAVTGKIKITPEMVEQ